MDDVVYILSDMLTNDLRYRVGHTFSERLGKELLEKWLLAYWDKLLSKDGIVEAAKENDGLSVDLRAMQDFRDAIGNIKADSPPGGRQASERGVIRPWQAAILWRDSLCRQTVHSLGMISDTSAHWGTGARARARTVHVHSGVRRSPR